MQTIRWLVSITLLSIAAVSCTEANPNSCATNPKVCRPGTTCQGFKDSSGAPYSRCVASEGPVPPDGDVADQRDTGTSPTVDAGSNRETEGSPVDAATKDTMPATGSADAASRDAMSDTGSQVDSPTQPDVPGCTNACALGSKQCGAGGGLQSCVVGGSCTAWGPESSCGQYACSGTACKATCSGPGDCAAGYVCRAPACAQPSCGDGTVDPGEECDKGAANSANAYGPDLCTDKCKRAPYCGDSITNGPEKCDGGGTSSTALGACNPECSGFYEKKFIQETQNFYNANLGGIAGADMKCQAEFGTKYKALLVGGSRRATATPLKGDSQLDWVTRKYTHYYNGLDQLVWRTDDVNLLGVRDGQRMNLYGKAFTEAQYPWSGFASDWTTVPDMQFGGGTCMGWTYAQLDQQGSFCLDDLSNGAGEPCSASQRLLCVEQ